MTYQVRILQEAEEDIERNGRWWAENHSVDQAVRWMDEIREQIRSLSTLPARCSLSAENDDFPFEIRDHLIGLGSRPSYRAVFTIHSNAVYIVTIRRAAEDRLQPGDINFSPEQD